MYSILPRALTRAIIALMSYQQLTNGRVTWTNIVNPTPADVGMLHQAYPFVHPLNLEDLLSPIERPKIDEDDNYLFAVMHFPIWDPDRRISRSSEVDLFVGRGYVISIHEGVLRPLVNLWARCAEHESARQEVMGRGANRTFYTIIDQLVDYIFPILRRVDANIHAIEDDIFTANTRLIIRDIAVVRRDLIALRRIIRHQVPILENLEGTEHPIITEDLEEYFGDIADHLYKARDIVEENYEVIVGLAETADTLASHRINEVMRILTVFSVILLPLTLLSGIYGMNLDDLPFKENPNSFIIVSGFMISIAVFMLIYFRRRNWL